MITAAQIRAGRALINAKQSELAKAAGISLATLNNIERGVGDPRYSTLEAIERALGEAGVRLENDRATESVILRRLTRPDAFDTFFASERVLEVLRPGSLTKVAKVLFFARWNRDGVGGEDADRVRVCLLIEGEARAVLFDQVGFSVAATSRVAEVAGMMVAAFAFHRDKLFYLDQVLEDTTVAALEEAVPRLRSLPWQKLDHPAAFFDVFDDWEGRLMAFAERPCLSDGGAGQAGRAAWERLKARSRARATVAIRTACRSPSKTWCSTAIGAPRRPAAR